MVNILKFSKSIDNLKNIRNFVSSRLQELSIPELEINMMVLAVDEICANMILHEEDESQRFIEVSVKNENEGVAFEIANHSEKFDVNTYQTPDIDQLIQDKRKGGIGLMLVKKIMDKIELRKEENSTILRLFKKISFAK